MLQAIVNGLLIGSVYSLIGIGLFISFSYLHVIDLAVGEWLMLGAYIGYFVSLLSIDPLFVVPVAFLLFIPIGYLIFRKIISRVLKRDLSGFIMTIVLTFGFSIAIKGISMFLFTEDYRRATSKLTGNALEFKYLNLSIPLVRIIVGMLGVIIIIALFYFLKKTKTGNAIRAISQNIDAAKLMGVKTDKVLGLTYGISLSMLAAAGVALSSFVAVYPMMGTPYTLFAFFIVILGGVGYLPGVLVGGITLGIIESLTSYFSSDLYIHIIVFSFLYLVLLFSPSGILRKGEI